MGKLKSVTGMNIKRLLLTFAQWEDWSLDWTTIILLFSAVNSFPTIFSVFQPEKWIPEERKNV